MDAGNRRKRALVIVGTRPEAIKMAPVVEALRRREERIETRVCLTGQHTSLVTQVLGAFDLSADYDLQIMQDGQTLYDVIHRAVDGIRDVVREFRPDVLLVQGDTATVFAGALVGFLEKIKVGHVEAGLRSHDKWAPFPEEGFRRLADVLSDYYFAPTSMAAEHLLAEGVPNERVHVTGNTVVDALQHVGQRGVPIDNPDLAAVLDAEERVVLLTAHRRESFGEPIREVFRGVRALVEAVPNIRVVYPVHPNPNVRSVAREALGDHERIHLLEPLSYFDLAATLRHARLVLTDSGGIQEEAPAFGVPVLVLRDVTERPEGVLAGVAELVGTDATRILSRGVAKLANQRAVTPVNPYGDGLASERIADIVVSDLTGAERETTDWRTSAARIGRRRRVS